MEISKFRSRLPSTLEQVTGHLRGVENGLARIGRTVADKLSRLRGVLRTSENRLSVRLNQAAARLRAARNALARLGISQVDGFRRFLKVLRVGMNSLLELIEGALSAVAIATSRQIAKSRSQLFVTLRHVIAGFQSAWNALARLGRRVVDEPRIRREALRASERELHELLASSRDAIVVTNGDRCFVAANPKALDLLGISDMNVTKFSIDVFFSRGQVLGLGRNSSPFQRREGKHGKCKIRRLDGSLRLVEFAIVSNFLPLMHLYKFSDITQERPVQLIAKVKSPTAIIKYRPTS